MEALLSIIPTFYGKLLHQFLFNKKKITNPNCNHIKAAKSTFQQKKAAHKMLVKLAPLGKLRDFAKTLEESTKREVATVDGC